MPCKGYWVSNDIFLGHKKLSVRIPIEIEEDDPTGGR